MISDQEIKNIFRVALEVAVKNGHELGPTNIEQIMYGFDIEPALEMIYIPVIYSHDFAKTFFGSKWKNHLQKMVLEEEPIRYIERFLVENYKKEAGGKLSDGRRQ